ncbi:MAG: hypothetical protein JMDDDDMK_05572 [Acidobacteria bacterium]|nr:hypothetical protein [Acidobacteriota bacterium]
MRQVALIIALRLEMRDVLPSGDADLVWLIGQQSLNGDFARQRSHGRAGRNCAEQSQQSFSVLFGQIFEGVVERLFTHVA